MISLNIRPFTDRLRKLGGWVQDDDSMAGGGRTVFFNKRIGHRELRMQLCGDGRHRISHAYGETETTYPTEFSTPDDMVAAIEIETARTDWKSHHAAQNALLDALTGYAVSLREQPNCRTCTADDAKALIMLYASRAFALGQSRDAHTGPSS